jgi:aspartyl-tRNA synthetase
MLTKSTKEGARDFIVPSPFKPGKFYALATKSSAIQTIVNDAGVEIITKFALF